MIAEIDFDARDGDMRGRLFVALNSALRVGRQVDLERSGARYVPVHTRFDMRTSVPVLSMKRYNLHCEKPLIWIGSSHEDLMRLPVPVPVRKFFGFALSFAQRGERHDSAKTLSGFGDACVLEIVERDADGTYRAVYTVRFDAAVFVLHAFQKKSRRGIETPKADLQIVRDRLKIASATAKELQSAKDEKNAG